MAQKQKLGIRAYSFCFKKYRSRGADKIFELNSELRFPTADEEEYIYPSALDLFHDFITYSSIMDDKEGNQQLFRCSFDDVNRGETDSYRYLIFSVHSGYYGFPSDLIDRTTKQTVYRKTKDQADVKEFYVMVVIPKDSGEAHATRGLIYFQEIGVYGVKTITVNSMQEFFSKKLGLTFVTQNLAPDFYLDKLFASGIIKKIRLARNVSSADSADRLYGQHVGREERAITPIQVTRELKQQLRHIAEGRYTFYTFDDINYPEVKMEVAIGDRTRTINLHGIEELSIEEALPDDLLLADGTISMESFTAHMHTIAEEYLEHLPTSL